jgi:sugar (pentulose or hexulose) kinase
VTGGFISSDLWLQIAADVLGTDLEVPRITEGAAWGAALLAMDAVGVITDLDAVASSIEIARTIRADGQATQRYDEVASRYAQLADRVEPLLRDDTLA